MKKSFVGFALVASLLAGCQTAQKSNEYETVNLDEMFPGYGTDRRPANVTPLLDDVYKALANVSIAGKAGAKEVSAQAELLTYVNRLRSEEVRTLKRAKNPNAKNVDSVRLTKEDINGLSPTSQAKIASDFLSSKGLADLPQLNAIRAKVQDEMARVAGTDARASDRAMTEKLKASSAAVNKNVKMKNASETVSKNSTGSLQAAFKDLEDVLVRAAAGEKEAVELRRELFALRKTAGEVWEVTGDSHLIPETCENLDATTLPQYRKLLADIRDEFRGYAKKDGSGRYQRVACKNKSEITAYVAAKYQQALGRRGVSALTAVQEMTFCNYLKSDVADAARKLASVGGGDLPKAPDCN
jgi:hypothetical protein